MSSNIKIVPGSSLMEFSGSAQTESIVISSGSALNLAYVTSSQNDVVDILKLKRVHPSGASPGAGTSIGIAYYGQAASQTNLNFAKDIYTLKDTGSLGVDSTVVYKKALRSFNDNVLIEKKAPGIHEEFILSDNGVNNEQFIRRSYMFSGVTIGPNQNDFLRLNHSLTKNISWIELNQNESAQITVRIIARAGGNAARSRGFLINGYADTLNAAATIAGNYAIVNSTGQANTAPPNNWNVQLQFVNDYLGGQTNYIRIQVFNNTAENETIQWTAYVELLVNTSNGTARYGAI